MIVGDAKDNLSGLLHGADVEDVEGWELCFERAANTVLSKLNPIDTERIVPLSNPIHDNIYKYALPSDVKDIIDLYPEDNRTVLDTAIIQPAKAFDLQKAFRDKTASIESSEGSKFLSLNWHSRAGKVLNTMDSLTSNGSWAVVGSASGLKATTLFKVSGSGSVEFDLALTGDGIQNTTMTALDLTNEDQVADIFVPVYFGDVSKLTSISVVWGNDLTTKFWTSTAQTTQADGTPFRVGWNILKFSWSTALQTGTVAPASIHSFKLTVAATGAIANIRVDNIIFSIGRNFDIKYYSKFLFKNTAGTWISRPTSDSDTIVLDTDAIDIWIHEALIECAQQIESSNSGGDISYARLRLNGDSTSTDPSMRLGLYAKYKKRFPNQTKKMITTYGSSPARGRW